MKKATAIVLLTFILGVFFIINKVLADDAALSQREVADSTRPAVVKIVQHVKGNALIPVINVDFKTLTVATDKESQPEKIQIDEYLTGSGVIVAPDGYIITNSHVVSYQTIKNLIVSDYIYQAIDDGYAKLSEEEVKSISENNTQQSMSQFAEKITDYMLAESKFDLVKSIAVLNPASRSETLEELFNEGFTASVISVNDNFFKDSRDAALIKIDQQDLPAVSLADSPDVSTGKKIYIFGYPSTAEINEKDLLEPTFSQGTISAIKDSPGKDFKILQTDAKISKGSSGGPMLDEEGKVVGLVTFITNDLTMQDGDSFAFAVPIDEVQDIIAENSTGGRLPEGFKDGAYASHFLSGLALLKKNQCRNAIEEFNSANIKNENFGVARFTAPYIKQCEETILSGNSVDSFWELFRSKLEDTKYLVVSLSILGVILLALLAFAWYWLFRRMRSDEKELDNIEHSLNLDLESGLPVDENKAGINDLPDNSKPKTQ